MNTPQVTVTLEEHETRLLANIMLAALEHASDAQHQIITAIASKFAQATAEEIARMVDELGIEEVARIAHRFREAYPEADSFTIRPRRRLWGWWRR